MRLAISVLAAAAALVWLAPVAAEAQSRGARAKAKPPHGATTYYRYYRRPASVGHNGLCQRDTGTPTGQLNFRNRCDVEEFWNRTIQGGRRW